MAILQALLAGGGGPPGGAPAGADPLAALAGGGGGADPAALAGGGGDQQLADLLGGAGPGDQGDGNNPPEIGNWSAVDHIRAAIKHLMMAMTNTQDDQQGHGIAKGMAALHGILAGDQKNKQTIANAGG